jgi:hypothetical protein
MYGYYNIHENIVINEFNLSTEEKKNLAQINRGERGS